MATNGSTPTTKYASTRYLRFDWTSTHNDDKTSYTINWVLHVVGRTSTVGYWDLRELSLKINMNNGTFTRGTTTMSD